MVGWGADAVLRELAGVAAGLTKAMTELAEAAEHATAAAGRMAAGQLYGVAAGLGRITSTLQENHGTVRGLADQVTPLLRAAQAVTAESLPDDVVSALTPVQQGIDSLLDGTGLAIIMVNRTDTVIRAVLRGGSPGTLSGHVTRAIGILRAARTRLVRAEEATGTVLVAAGNAGQLARAGGPAQPVDPSRTPGAGAPPVIEELAPHDLSAAQQANLVRYRRKLPAAAEHTTVSRLPDGSVRFQTRVPGRVPGSYALYTKTIGQDGTTVAYTKTTVLPDGSIAHVKDKMPR